MPTPVRPDPVSLVHEALPGLPETTGQTDIDMFFLPSSLPPPKIPTERPAHLQLFHQPIGLFLELPPGSTCQFKIHLWGLGPKDEMQMLAKKSKFAGIMLSHGVACHDVADFTGKIGKAIAPGKIMHDLSIMKKTNGWSVLKDWLHPWVTQFLKKTRNLRGCEVPEEDKKLERPATKIQQAVRKF